MDLSAASVPLRRGRDQRRGLGFRLAVPPAGLQAVCPARARGGGYGSGGPHHCSDTHPLPESLVTLASGRE